MTLNTRFLATGIGSMPYQTPEEALDVVFACFNEAPIWPQLPQAGLNEQMVVQYSEGIPCLKIDRQKNLIYFNTSGDCHDSLADFYKVYCLAMDPDEGNGDCSALAISPEYSKGIYAAEKRLNAMGQRFPYFKVHTTGPCTLALNVTDEHKRAVYHNKEYRDVIVKALAMKCRWQIHKFQPFAKKVICFIDEPILYGIDSPSFKSVQRVDVVSDLHELIEAIHMDGGIAGIHCCGNTDWSVLVEAGVDILNFDAFEFGESITKYPEIINDLLNRGGAIAWGIVPTSEKIMGQTIETLSNALGEIFENLVSQGIDKKSLLEQSMITPSCGTGFMQPKQAKLVFEMTANLSRHLRDLHGL